MAEEKRRLSPVRRGALWVAVVAAALLALRSLGPGGAPTEEPTSPPATPPPGMMLQVTFADRSAAPGARIEITFDEGSGAAPITLRPTPSGEDGSTRVVGAPPRWKSLRARADLGPLHATHEVENSSPTEVGPLDLVLALPATFAVAGTVLASEDGRPLEGMDVRLGEKTAKCDERGRFAFPGLPAELLRGPALALEVKGSGRKPVSRALPADQGMDDLVIRAEAE